MRKEKKKYKYNGKELLMKELCELTGVSSALIYNRLLMGWSVERAVETPKANRGFNGTPSKGTVERDYNKNRKKALKLYAVCDTRINAK